jgi:hypothetical protein
MPPTPIMTDIIVKILIELLSVLSLATKQVEQGRFSKCAVYIYPVCGSMCHREVHTEVVRGERDRGGPTAIGSIDAG